MQIEKEMKKASSGNRKRGSHIATSNWKNVASWSTSKQKSSCTAIGFLKTIGVGGRKGAKEK